VAGGHIFDGSGADPFRADLLIEDGRILDVGHPPGTEETVDATGLVVLPGLIDCHTHVLVDGVDLGDRARTPFSYRFYQAARNLRATLATGVTTIRDAGGADAGIRAAVEDGLIAGPRMQVSLAMISQTGGHGDVWLPSGSEIDVFPRYPGRPATVADGPDEVRRAVRDVVRMGADVVKVGVTGGVLSAFADPAAAHYSPDELAVLVREANAANRPVMAHAHGAEGAKNAIRAGVKSIEHGTYLDDEALDLMAERGTWLVPTLLADRGVLEAADRGSAVSSRVAAKARSAIAAQTTSFRRAIGRGIPIAMGTDSGVTAHGRNLEELALMVAHGMSPGAALRAATSDAARLLGIDADVGSIEPGKVADFVLVAGSLARLDDLPSRIHSVYQAGSRVA
jgi:imidazolonepropionase-like amidohydrolase